MNGMNTSIFGGSYGMGGGALTGGDSFATGDMRMPRVFGGVSARGQKVRTSNPFKKGAKNVLKRKGK